LDKTRQFLTRAHIILATGVAEDAGAMPTLRLFMQRRL
jgi:hypothetical protein